MDAGQHPYMQYTVRETFWKGQTKVKVVPVLRNANYDTAHLPSLDYKGGTFNTAYKGLQALEWRIDPQLPGPVSYTMATDSTPQTGTLSSTDDVTIYQGQSQTMILGGTGCDYQSGCANKFTTDLGYVAKKNTTTVIASGDATKVVGGWMDCASGSGAGLEIGVYQMSAYWPKISRVQGGRVRYPDWAIPL